MTFTSRYLEEVAAIAASLDVAAIEQMATGLADVRERGGRLFILGAGGGAGHASHAVNDFRKICGLESYCPSDNVSELTARVNDEGWDVSYANWLKGSRLSARDGILVFSVGGGSRDPAVSLSIVNALDLGREVGAAIFGVDRPVAGLHGDRRGRLRRHRACSRRTSDPARRGVPGGRLASPRLAPGACPHAGHVGAPREGRGSRDVSTGAAVFLDRDGVINDVAMDPLSGLYESPYRVEDVHLAATAVAALQLLAKAGFLTAVVSNQPAAAKGTHTSAELDAVHAEVVRQLAEAGVRIDVWRYCRHHPTGVDPDLGRACDCRKPAPGLILDAAEALGLGDLSSSWMIGDSDVDVAAGRAAGCRTILIEHAPTAHRRSGGQEPDHRVDDVLAAARRVALAAARMGETP